MEEPLDALLVLRSVAGELVIRRGNDVPGELETDLALNGSSLNGAMPSKERVIVTAQELLKKKFPEPRFAVPGIIAEGVTLLASKPKLGKTWLVMGLGVAVASGRYALGAKKVEQGSALLLLLEDHMRRVQGRLKKLLPDQEAPEKLEIATDWPRLHEGGAEAIEGWLEDHTDARLVVIDTLAKIRRPARSQNVYSEDYAAVESLVHLAAKYRVAIVVVHHLRKMLAADPLDEISGSTGLTGGVDGVLVLKRDRGKADAYLHVTGRDIEEEQELALEWDGSTASWTIKGDAEECRMSDARANIVEALKRANKPTAPKEIAEIVEKDPNAIHQLLHQMHKDGQVASPERGLYTLPGNKNDKDDKESEGDAGRDNQILTGLIDLSGDDANNSLTAGAVAEEFRRRGSGASKNLPHYLRGDTSLEILTKSVLQGLRGESHSWKRYTSLVHEAARDGRNHGRSCPCDLCLVAVEGT